MKIFILLTNNLFFGDEGENIAGEYLENKGYKIVEKKWRFHHKELDLIAKKGNLIIFIEVKTRSSEKYLRPEESVSEKKASFLIEAAEAYLEEKNLDLETRFDVIAIIKNKNVLKINHIEGAL